MKQTTKTLAGLGVLVLVAAAIGGAALWTKKDEAEKTEAKEKSEKLFDFDKAKVKSLKLEKEGKLTAALEKGDKGWKLVQPIEAEGDDNQIDSLLTSLTGLKQKKDLGDEKDYKSYGLDAPKLRVTVKLDDGKEQGLETGVDNTFDNTLYVKKLGDPVVRIVDGYQRAQLDKQLLDLRNKKVAHLDDAAEVKKIEVAGVKNPYVLEKDGNTWKVNGEPGDPAAGDRVLSAIRSLQASGIAAEKSDKLADYGLDKPKATVKLMVASGKDAFARTVVIGQAKGGAVTMKTYAKRDDSPIVFEVAEQILKDLEKEPFELQDKALVKTNREDVKKFVFESPAGKVEVTRTKTTPPDGGFADDQYAVVGHGPAKKWKMSSASYSITSLRAAAFEGPAPKDKDLAKYGLDKPRTVTLYGDGDKVLARVRTGGEKDGKRYVLVDGVDKLARVEKATIDEWPWTLADALEPPAGDAGVQAAK